MMTRPNLFKREISMELTQLIEKVKQQDQQAFEELYNRYYQAGFSLALQFVKNQDDALDIMHDVFVTVYSKLGLLESAAKFKSWYMQIVANKCKDFLKKQMPLSFTDANAYDEDGALQFEIEETHRDFIPEEAVDYSETVRIVDEMIAELPEEQRLCILLYFANDMTIPEIAQALQVSEATVKSRLKYGKDKIRAKTDAYEKKTGTRLYSLAGLMLIPFLRWALKQNAASTPQAPAGTFANIVEALPATGSALAGTTANTAATVASAGGFLQRLSTAQKVIGGIVAGAIVLGSSVAVTTVLLPKDTEDPTTPTSDQTQTSKPQLHWDNYIKAEFSGSSGHATVTVEVNFPVVDALFGQEKLRAFLAENGGAEQASSVASLLEFSLSAEENLSNGDTVTVTVLPSALMEAAGNDMADIAAYFGLTIDTEMVLTVEGLREFTEIDIFSMVKEHIIYEGVNGEAYAYWNFPEGYQQEITDRIRLDFMDSEITVNVDDEPVGTIELSLLSPTPQIDIQDDLEFIYFESGPLANGDLLTIELGDYHREAILEGLNPLGYTIETLIYKLEVSGL